MRYVLMEYADRNNYTASSKARNDAAAILKKAGAVYIPLFKAKSGHSTIAASIIKNCLHIATRLKKGDIVFIQYPYNPQIVNTILIRLLSSLVKIKKSKICVLMHDINSFRFTDEKEKENKLFQEVKLLNKVDYLIAHNEKMIDLLKEHGCSTTLLNLRYFDYLYNGKLPKAELSSTIKVIIAGNLSAEKSGYIYHLPQDSIMYELYGVNFRADGIDRTNVVYRGAYSPEELIGHLDGSFGMVWDGPSVQTCEGNYGTYLKYNDPHKFSLYIAAGLPVIVWKESALATLVEEKRIGITINAISEIADITKDITPEDYEKMKNNVDVMRKEVSSGQRLMRVISDNNI